ncbi:protein FAM124A [Hoplias malabaricus]|uniref:protein FAM124A n=1 Tax=Hoplias malabaricus TaxID=27720 RepID=UPI00346365F9
MPCIFRRRQALFFFSLNQGDLYMGDLQDPFLVSIHIIADPGQGQMLQHAADKVLSLLHPELTLFRVSECTTRPPRKSILRQELPTDPTVPQPALAVILFLHDVYGCEESQDHLRGQLRKHPWCYHHTEQVNGYGLLPLSPASQDFFTLAPGTPLWAIRQVHYGKKIVRFTIYCRHETYSEQVHLYRLLLHRRLAQRKEDFCFCIIYSNHDTEIQLSLKQLTLGQKPIPMECAIMEMRVRDVAGLIPFLPHPCSPISNIRWKTEDYDGNRILLQVQGSWKQHRSTTAQFSWNPLNSSSIPAPTTSESPVCLPTFCSPTLYRKHRHCNSSQITASPCTKVVQNSLPLLCKQDDMEYVQDSPEDVNIGSLGFRSRSTFSLPTEELVSMSPSLSAARPQSLSSLATPVFRINVDALVGAKETDVDTGQAVIGDLSVVSAYSYLHSPTHIQQPLPSLTQDVCSKFTVRSDKKTYSTLKRHPLPSRTRSLSSRSMNCAVHLPLQNSTATSQCQVQAMWAFEHYQGNNTEIKVCIDGKEEDKQEFYI